MHPVCDGVALSFIKSGSSFSNFALRSDSHSYRLSHSQFLTWKCAGSSFPCLTRLHSATELLSSVHSVSRGSLFTLLQNGWIDFPRADRRSIQSMHDLKEGNMTFGHRCRVHFVIHCY